jgi:DNA-binding CsgD family transcriptional regulator
LQQDVEHLIGLAYDALYQPQAWNKFVFELSGAVNADAAQMSIAPMDGFVTAPIAFHAATRLEDIVHLLPEYGRQHPFLNAALQKGVAPGIYSLPEAVPRETWRGWDYYEVYMRAAKIEHGLHMLLGRGTPGGSPPVLVAVGRDDRAQDFEERERRLLVELFPHLRRITRLSFHPEAVPAFDPAIGDAFDQFVTPCILIGLTGKVVFLNRAANAVNEAQRSIKIEGDRLRCFNRKASLMLETAIKGAVGIDWGWEGRRGAEIVLPAADGSCSSVAVVVPLGPDNPFLGWVGSVRAAVYLLDPNTALPPVPNGASRLAALFSLTSAEAEVMSALIRGKTISEIAMERNSTDATVRSHLKAVFSKTDTHRQAELGKFRSIIEGPH